MSFHSFIAEKSLDEGLPEDLGVLYYSRNGSSSGSFSDALDKMANKRLAPRYIIIVCMKGEQGDISNYFTHLPQSTKQRIHKTEGVLLFPYGYNGDISTSDAIELQGATPGFMIRSTFWDAIIRRGLEILIEETGVILEAPKGYIFEKPSSNQSPRFIRTGNMLRDPASLSVITHAVVRLLPEKVETLYIDSGSILALALSFQKAKAELAVSCGVELPSISIRNFHSYAITEDFRFPGSSDYHILISATASGSLANRLASKHGAFLDRIFHCISFCDDNKLEDSSAFFKTRKSQGGKKMNHKLISIRGEDFLASHSEPEAVKITINHICDNDRKLYKERFYQDGLRLNLRARHHEVNSLFSIEKGLSNNKPFIEWLNSEVQYNLPMCVDLIVHCGDSRSKGFARLIQKRLNKLLGGTIRVADLQTISQDYDSYKSNTVLICCATTGSGEDLLMASQQLRPLKHEHRHYIVGHAFPANLAKFNQLTKNLTKSGSGRDYSFSTFHVTAIGKTAFHDTWSNEPYAGDLISEDKIDALPMPLSGCLKERKLILARHSLTENELFLPRLDGAPLTLRADSVLFSSPYRAITQTTVYLSVSTAIQRAREGRSAKGKELAQDQWLQGNPFVSSILDPDMFSRFNDGVIQAAILRSCTADELNYSSSATLSHQMARIIQQIIERRNTDAGEAVLEFLLALFTKRLRLVKDDFAKLETMIKDTPILQDFWSLLHEEAPF